MSDRSIAFAISFSLVFATVAAAQSTQPIVAPAPASPEILTRYYFHLSIARLIT